jgi:hypothetical protein
MIILQVFNPFLYFFSISIFNNFLIITPEITLLKIIILLLCNFILKSNFFYIFIEKLAINDFILFFG